MKNSSATTKSFRSVFAPNLFWTFVLLGVCALLLLGRFWIKSQHKVFLKTTSPDHTYTVSLKGNKGRPWIIPYNVRADVSKAGQPLLSDIWLHSAGDAFDLSFESGFPDVRWLTDNIVEFYRAEYFEWGADSLRVENKAGKPIKYLCVQSVNKFLTFDLRSGALISVKIPAPRSDYQWIGIEGAFSDGASIPFYSRSFDRRFRKSQDSIYQISVGEAGASIDELTAAESSKGPSVMQCSASPSAR